MRGGSAYGRGNDLSPLLSRATIGSMDPHALAEARSLALHRAVWARIEARPELLDGVRARLEAWREDDSRPQPYVEAWLRLLDGPREALRAVLLGTDEAARAMRQATPFAGIVDPRERWRIWAEVRDSAPESA